LTALTGLLGEGTLFFSFGRLAGIISAMNKIRLAIPLLITMLGSLAWASPLSPEARALIPSTVRQIISVDYRMARTFDTAMTLKAQTLPDNLREFESALKSVGVNPDRDVESLTFFSFDRGKDDIDMVGMASGSFPSISVRTELGLRKIKPIKFHDADLYPVSKTMSLTILGESTVLLGSNDALETALNVRNGGSPNVEHNQDLMEMIKTVEKSTVWSVLDRRGTQNMLTLALGEAGRLPTFAGLKEYILGSHYTMNFRKAVRLDVDLLTYDRATATKLSALLKAGVLYKKVTANPEQRTALDHLTVAPKRLAPDSDRTDLRVQFKADESEFQSMLRSRCFTAMSTERKELSGVTSRRVLEEPTTMSERPSPE
jgi:hypothetical protein